MIKPEELRIGIYVYLFGDIVQLDKDHILYLLSENRPMPEPVTLTEELLVKAGFGKKDVTWSDKSVSKDIFVYAPYFVEFTKYGIVFCHMNEESNLFIREVKYLHQLQNLFWILTGTELTIKLNIVDPIENNDLRDLKLK